jgi:tetratricopeptide (TPR) repeat protein
VVTDGGEKRGRDVAIRFEQMRAVFGTLFFQSSVNLPAPLQIVAFRSTKELLEFAPLWNGKPTEVAGLFLSNTDRSFILLDLSVDNPWAVVFHEYAHQLMDGNAATRMDPWFEEGFAEYFASIEVDGKEAHVGKIPEHTYRILQQTGLMSTALLLRVQPNSRIYNERGGRRSGFYAQSAMLVHYLYDNELTSQLAKYFELADDRKIAVEDALQQAFGMTAQQFDDALRTYVREGRYKYYRMRTPSGIVTTSYVTTTLSVADSSVVLADVHLHSPDYGPKAMGEYQAILHMDPKNASALRGLGYWYLLKKDFEAAGKYFRQAAETDSRDPRVHYYAALLMSRERILGDAKNIPVMARELETSIALDPGFADAYSLLAFAYAYAGDSEKGLETIRKALSLSPRNETYIFNLAQMYLNDRNPDEAITIFESLRNARNPAVAMKSVEMIELALEMKTAIASGKNVVISHIPQGEDEQGGSEPEQGEAVAEYAAAEAPVDLAIKQDRTARLVSGPPRFVKGKVASVDCSATPEATLDFAAGTGALKLHVRDTKQVIVIGADAFSCKWANQKLAVNYLETSPSAGEVMSLEVQ